MELITTTEELADVCARLARHPVITVDTEFLRETTYYPLLCVVQMASAEEAVVIDTLAEGIDLKPFFTLMADEKVLKIFHAARQDIEIVWHQAGIVPHPIFDTQVAAMVLGYGDSIAYDQLVERITGHRPNKTHRFTDWSRRPLTDDRDARTRATPKSRTVRAWVRGPEEEVVGLRIAVDDPLGVRALKGDQRLAGNTKHLGNGDVPPRRFEPACRSARRGGDPSRGRVTRRRRRRRR